eukprot:COSAG05_NODE_6109_length_1021_cov_0.824295_2_plen_45_part_01
MVVINPLMQAAANEDDGDKLGSSLVSKPAKRTDFMIEQDEDDREL